jgi:KaiC/GvpD/RAD55 family RecA-like ATPase
MNPVPSQLLEELGKEFAPATPAADATSAASSWVERWLERHPIVIRKIEPYKGGRRFILACCPFKSDHTGTSAAIFEEAGGRLGFKCLHEECKDRGWTDLRRLFEPDFGRKKADASPPLKTVIGEIPSVRNYASAEVKFVVPGLIPKGTVSLISGPAESGKTTFTLWLADAIAQGRRFMGDDCSRHPVLYLTRENPAEYIVDLLNRLRIEDGPGTNLQIWGGWQEETPPPPASAHLLAWVTDSAVAPLIIVDSLISFYDGDENSAGEIRQFFHQCRRLIQAGAAAVILLHHPGKSETANIYRGSSDILPAVDALYKLTNSGDGRLEKLYLKAHKARFSAQRRELVFEYRDGGFEVDERPQAVRETIGEQLKNLLATLAGSTKTEFVRAAQAKQIPRRRTGQFLDEGLKGGWIRRERGLGNTSFYYPATPEAN